MTKTPSWHGKLVWGANCFRQQTGPGTNCFCELFVPLGFLFRGAYVLGVFLTGDLRFSGFCPGAFCRIPGFRHENSATFWSILVFNRLLINDRLWCCWAYTFDTWHIHVRFFQVLYRTVHTWTQTLKPTVEAQCWRKLKGLMSSYTGYKTSHTSRAWLSLPAAYLHGIVLYQIVHFLSHAWVNTFHCTAELILLNITTARSPNSRLNSYSILDSSAQTLAASLFQPLQPENGINTTEYLVNSVHA